MSAPCPYCHYPRSSDDGPICKSKDTTACAPCRKVADLDEEIHTLRKKIVELEERRRQWKTQMNASHDGLTRKIPVEVMAEIFELCLPEDVCSLDMQYRLRMHVLGMPLILSAVSQRWRQIAQASPRLWSDVPVRILDRNIPSLPDLVHDWIERSGQRPLSINIHTARNSKCANGVIKVLNNYASRWKNLAFSGDWLALCNFASDIEGVSNIQTLSLKAGVGKSRQKSGKFDLKKFIVQPKTLVVEPIIFGAINIDWSYLTELEASTESAYECVQVVRLAPLLKKCKFSTSSQYVFQPSVAPPNPFLHPRIEELIVLGRRCGTLFDYFRCPALQKLTFGHCHHPGTMDKIVYFLQQSMCSITNLTTYRMQLQTPDTDIYLLCQAIPTLQHLSIDSRSMSLFPTEFDTYRKSPIGHLFPLLAQGSTTKGNQTPYLPELRSLIISDSILLPWSTDFWNTFLSIYSARTKLDSVMLFSDRTSIPEIGPGSLVETCDENTRRKFLALKEKGVKVKVPHPKTGKDLMLLL
ncbi:hypothetical protein BDN70DRAFT_874206 [Pholiota conissans]|uniref:F-box domain-containing protein n=1 Tax=Pholiota conissans TaxID=109636 RepID=A0A9P5Z9N8_9AGAR|nr:hypothetical protein BDN70DRAFT_874206 [Pholiota conissans]